MDPIDFSPEFRRRLDMIVARARADVVSPGRYASGVGPDGPLPEGAAAKFARFNEKQLKESE